MDEVVTGESVSNPDQGDTTTATADAPATQDTQSQPQADTTARAPKQRDQFSEFRSTYDKKIKERDDKIAAYEQRWQQQSQEQQAAQHIATLAADYERRYLDAGFPAEQARANALYYAQREVEPQQKLAVYEQREREAQQRQAEEQLYASRRAVGSEIQKLYGLSDTELETIGRTLDFTDPSWMHTFHVNAATVQQQRAAQAQQQQNVANRNTTPFLAGASSSAASNDPNMLPPGVRPGTPEAAAYIQQWLHNTRQQGLRG